MSMGQLIDIHHPVTICKASAGTGKTFTLSAYYVGLLLSGEDYRSILAITFTNKATSEMSERIIRYLHGIAEGGEKDFLRYARQFMIRDAGVPDEELQRRAARCFKQMLLDYDNVQIMTIDSFLQTLLSGLAGVLKMSAGLNTELDVDHVIRQAVDQLLTTEMTEDDRVLMEDYMLLKLDEESRWDVRKSLCDMAKELYNESVQILDADKKIVFDATKIARRREELEKRMGNDPRLEELKGLLAKLEVAPIDVSYGKQIEKDLNALVRNTRASLFRPDEIDKAYFFRGLSDSQYEKVQNKKWENVPPYITDLAEQITTISRSYRRDYHTLQLTIKFSRDMQLMGSLQALIQRNLSEANSALLARTANTLCMALKEGDADFILEKAGIRFRHVLMDEFQDTSRLQWSVIKQLLQDLLAGTGHTLLIVGDIKQSIYRWRNGDWHIMEGLCRGEEFMAGCERRNERFTSLTRNFRSSEEVVRFNLSLFKNLIEKQQKADPSLYNEDYEDGKLESFYQAKKKKGGYVRFLAIPNGEKEDLVADMFDQMEQLLQKGAIPSDMMVLVREKKDAAFITSMHQDLDAAQYPNLSHAHIVSSDSFLLEASSAVCAVIAALRVVVRDDEVAAKYIEMVTGDPDAVRRAQQTVNLKTPLYEAICELIRALLTDEKGQYQGTETAYLNNLLDRTRAYVSTYGGDMNDFLTYWDDTMHGKAIPASSSDAIRIMTVHASKGLQAQTLFIPFCSWPQEAGRHPQKIWCPVASEVGGADFVPIQDGSDMRESAYQAAYEEEHQNMRVDNLNMLYVALTRAEDNLFVSTSYSVKKDGKKGACNHVGQYLMDYLKQDHYESGNPVIKTHGKQTVTNELRAELWANDDQVRFVQSQEGALYTAYGDEAYRKVAKMDEGNLCHEIFAHLRKADELEQVLDLFQSQGEIQDATQREKLRSLIASAWEGNAQMRDWFTTPWQLKLEQAIYIDHRELRPDRVMINPQTNEAIVLDYKFGHWEDKYKQQVRDYMEALRRMGYSPVRGYLWFAHQPGKQLVEVKSNLEIPFSV